MGNRDRIKRLSVVIVNYNYDAFVGAAITSALDVRWPDVEVVVIDDGSTDRSREIIAGFGDRVVSRFQDNAGQREAVNEGFSISTGDVVVFLDSDDMLPPDLAERTAAVWGPNVSKVQFSLQRIDGGGKPFGHPFPRYGSPPSPSTVRYWMTRTTAYPTPPGSGNAYARWFLDRLFPVGPEVGEASDSACLAAAPLLGEVVTVPEVVIGYRRHGANDSVLIDDPVRFSREVLRAQARWAYAVRAVSGSQVPVDERPLRRSRELLQFRVVAQRTSPLGGLPGDRRCRLVVDALRSPMHPGPEPVVQRLLVAAWSLVTLLAPRRCVPSLLAVRYREHPEAITAEARS